ncbi:hypothetical protein JHK87_009054 [Glycine soja]|nr:hypothetical protein JHK87_009054 [Glycine soja]
MTVGHQYHIISQPSFFPLTSTLSLPPATHSCVAKLLTLPSCPIPLSHRITTLDVIVNPRLNSDTASAHRQEPRRPCSQAAMASLASPLPPLPAAVEQVFAHVNRTTLCVGMLLAGVGSVAGCDFSCSSSSIPRRS